MSGVQDRGGAGRARHAILPFAITAAHKRDLGLDDTTLARVKARGPPRACVSSGSASRTTGSCPPSAFAGLREELGAAFEEVAIDSSPGNPHGVPRFAHSVLVYDLVDRPGHPTRVALDRVLAFFRERLLVG